MPLLSFARFSQCCLDMSTIAYCAALTRAVSLLSELQAVPSTLHLSPLTSFAHLFVCEVVTVVSDQAESERGYVAVLLKPPATNAGHKSVVDTGPSSTSRCIVNSVWKGQ